MPYFLVENFSAGLDGRRSILAQTPGSLAACTNAHVTSGGEIEKRKAFVAKYTLPAGTFGLAQARNILTVFGSDPPPSVPSGVQYMRIEHPSGLPLARVSMAEVFNGKIYAVGVYSDGSVHHFYDGVRVGDWFDGRARGGFTVAGGSPSNQAARGSFTISGGTSNPGVNRITAVNVGAVDVLGAAVNWTTSNEATAALVAAQINAFTSSPNYVATSSGATVTIIASLPGTAPNGLAITPVLGGNVTVSLAGAMAGGTGRNAVTAITVNGVNILGTETDFAVSNSFTAALIASRINTTFSSPEYTAEAAESTVNILAEAAAGAGPNGFSVQVTTVGDVVVSNRRDMANGVTSATAFTPGTVVKTIDEKMYVLSGSLMHFSKLNDPTKYQTSEIGAGFVNMNNHAGGSEELTAIGRYYKAVAVFARNAIQVWAVDPDPAENAKAQIIENDGTAAPRSVLGYGQNAGDLIYLASDGVRELRARDSSNLGTTGAVGAPINPRLKAYRKTLSTPVIEAAVAAIEPSEKRFLLAIGAKVYALSRFTESQVFAWSEYEPGFAVSDFTSVRDQLYVRSGNTIYIYGGDDGDTYDSSPVTVVIPYLTARAPATFKHMTGFDIAVEGEWKIEINTEPDSPNTWQTLGTVYAQTFTKQAFPNIGETTHAALRLTNAKPGPAKITTIAIHYEADEAA
jgi:hypothetical protein